MISPSQTIGLQPLLANIAHFSCLRFLVINMFFLFLLRLLLLLPDCNFNCGNNWRATVNKYRTHFGLDQKENSPPLSFYLPSCSISSGCSRIKARLYYSKKRSLSRSFHSSIRQTALAHKYLQASVRKFAYRGFSFI